MTKKKKMSAEDILEAAFKAWEEKKYDEGMKLAKEALDHPEQDNIGECYRFLGLCYARKKEYDLAVEYFQKSLNEPGYNTPGRALNSLGAVFKNKGDYSLALEFLQQALATPGYDTPGYALGNMGLVYAAKGEYDRAIECYQKALKSPGFDTPDRALNNMGIAYADKGDYDRAIECYEKSLATPGHDTQGHALNNLGIVYGAKGDYDRAIEFYEKALAAPGYESPGIALNNLGYAYEKKGEYELALEEYQAAREAYVKSENIASAALAERKIALIKKKMVGEKEQPGGEIAGGLYERAMRRVEKMGIKDEGVEVKIGKLALELGGLLTEQAQRTQEYLLKGAEENLVYPDPENMLSVNKSGMTRNFFLNLKGWSSNLPLVDKAQQSKFGEPVIVGGGYYINWLGKGIVIDPGIGFLDNFHLYKKHISQIDAIIVTHIHIDHEQDLSSIIDYLREYKELEIGKSKKVVLILDKQTYEKHQKDAKKIFGVTRVLQFDLANHESFNARLKGIGVKVSVKPFEARHKCDGAMGLKLIFRNENREQCFALGITSDTGWSKNLSGKLKDCDGLIAHFSKTDEEDLFSDELPPTQGHHLGYRGVLKLFRDTKAKFCVVAEWSGERGDIRYQVAELLKTDLRGTGKKVIPTDVGFCFSIPTEPGEGPNVRCRSCRSMVPYNEIIVGRPTVPYGRIIYSCEHCQGK